MEPMIKFRNWLRSATSEQIREKAEQLRFDALESEYTGFPLSMARECDEELDRRERNVTLFDLLDDVGCKKQCELYPADDAEGKRLFLFWMDDCFDPSLYVVAADNEEDADEILFEWMPKTVKHYLVEPNDEDYKEAISEAENGACGSLRWTKDGWLDTEALKCREIRIGWICEVDHG